MAKENTGMGIKIITTLCFLIMIVVNVLAVTLPLNGVETGQVSGSYPNLFAPAAVTFSIWGLIYILLALYTLYQLGFFQKNNVAEQNSLLKYINVYFCLSSLINAAWIFAWHYYKIPLSVILMLVLLLCLITINNKTTKAQLSGREKFFIRLPFSIYFGWITIATIANITVLLVSLGWNGFGLSEVIWTVIILIVGLIIAALTTLKNKDIAYGLVIIWAYAGILIKHFSVDGFNGQYPFVIITVIACVALMLFVISYVWFNRRTVAKIH